MRIMFLLVFFLPITLLGQKLISVEYGGNSSFYTTLADAITAAPDGAIIHLPGGTYTCGTINKGITILGTGSNLDSTSAVGITVINNSILLDKGSDNFHIEGVLINGSIIIRDTSYNLVIKRCILDVLDGDNKISTGLLTESILTKNGSSCNSCSCPVRASIFEIENWEFANNIIYKSIYRAEHNIFTNNLFIDSLGWDMRADNNISRISLLGQYGKFRLFYNT